MPALVNQHQWLIRRKIVLQAAGDTLRNIFHECENEQNKGGNITTWNCDPADRLTKRKYLVVLISLHFSHDILIPTLNENKTKNQKNYNQRRLLPFPALKPH